MTSTLGDGQLQLDAGEAIERLRGEENELLAQAAQKRKARERIEFAKLDHALAAKPKSQMSYREMSQVIAVKGKEFLWSLPD
jgi:hypothetical protein